MIFRKEVQIEKTFCFVTEANDVLEADKKISQYMNAHDLFKIQCCPTVKTVDTWLPPLKMNLSSYSNSAFEDSFDIIIDNVDSKEEKANDDSDNNHKVGVVFSDDNGKICGLYPMEKSTNAKIYLWKLIDSDGNKIDDHFSSITFPNRSAMSEFIVDHYIRTRRFKRCVIREYHGDRLSSFELLWKFGNIELYEVICYN